ncbi:MAG: hypothetical protein R3B13_24530 [Polyangiaceae bacterium]
MRRLALAAFALLFATTAKAQDAATTDAVDPLPERPRGMAEVGLGWLVLPAAEVCVERDIAGCTRGDSSFELDAWQLYRAHETFAIGAGMTLGLTPTTDAPRQDPPGTARDHSRGYFTVEAIARYYPYSEDPFEVWLGITSGLVVVSDRFESREGKSDRALVGPRGVTIRSEGYTVGLAAGGAYEFASRWSVGSSIRYGSWFLPETPNTDPLGDEASLVGQNDVFSVLVSVAYSLRL